MNIPALITALENAKGPDRALDGHIAKQFGWHRVEPRFTRNRKGGWIAPQDFIGLSSDGSPILDSLHGTDIHRDPPPLTRSLDAAVALAERVLPDANCHGYDKTERGIEAYVSRNGVKSGD